MNLIVENICFPVSSFWSALNPFSYDNHHNKYQNRSTFGMPEIKILSFSIIFSPKIYVIQPLTSNEDEKQPLPYT